MRFRAVLNLIFSVGQVAAVFGEDESAIGFSPVAQNPLTMLNYQGCNCTGIADTAANKTFFLCNNATLGPQLLPWRLPMLSLTSAYNRFGKLTPLEFLEKYRNKSSPQWAWRYPEQDGFQLDTSGRPIMGKMTLIEGFQVDRFGTEFGKYISAADAPFSQRSLPPDSLNVCKRANVSCSPSDSPWDYHVYIVKRSFEVLGGPIAPFYEQPGGGAQFKLNDTVLNLVALGFLERRNLSNIEPGPGTAQCGQQPVHCSCERPKA